MTDLHRRARRVGRQTLAAWVLAAVGATAHAHAGLAGAMQLYGQGQWGAAYADLAALADRGDAEAARISLLMLRHGPGLHDKAFSATSRQRDQGLRVASQQGAPASPFAVTDRP